MRRIDRLRGVLSLLHHAGQNSLPTLSIGYGPIFAIQYSLGWNRVLFQFILKFAMEINVREWNREDLIQIQRAWLEYFNNVARSDMHLRPDAETAMKQWLNTRFRQVNALGFVAGTTGVIAGFLI